jgi:hypothetical protein
MTMQPDIAKAQASTLAAWSVEWRREAEKGVEGAGEIGWQLDRLAKLVRAVAGIPAAVVGADEPERQLPAAASGEMRPG